MTITLNGKEHTLEESATVASLLETIGLGGKPVVVELNKTALFPREYSGKELGTGDQVEIITIAAGG